MFDTHAATVTPFHVTDDLTQVDFTDGRGTLWKKEILPSGTRNYKGQTLDFGDINPSCVEAFHSGAFDHVPFVLALADNSHSEDPTRLEGNLETVELSDDGRLIGYFDFSSSDQVPKIIAKSKGKFGVSARIEVDYQRPDTGKVFPYAIAHICGTLRPHLRGMNPWELVQLSDQNANPGIVIDLSNETATGEDTTEGTSNPDELVRVEMPRHLLDALMRFIDSVEEAEQFARNLTPDTAKPTVTASETRNEGLDMAHFFTDDSHSHKNPAVNATEYSNPLDEMVEERERYEQEIWSEHNAERIRLENDPGYKAFEADILRNTPGYRGH